MKKTYRMSWIALFWDFVRLVLGVAVLFAILSVVFDFKIATLASACFATLILIHIFRSSRIEVATSDRTLDISIGTRVYHYELERVSFRSEQINNDVLTLYVIDESGTQQEFDLSLLGVLKYHQILTDLGVIGDKSPVIQLNTQNNNK